MWVVHCTQCLYGHEFTLINTRSALSNESGKDMRNWKQKSLCSSCTYSKKQEKAGCCQLSICIYSKWDWIPLKIWVLFVTAFLTGGGWSCTKVRQRVFERSFPLMYWIVLLMRLTDTHRDLEYQKQVTEVCKTDLTFFQYIWKENLFKTEVRHWGQPICYPKGWWMLHEQRVKGTACQMRASWICESLFVLAGCVWVARCNIWLWI